MLVNADLDVKTDFSLVYLLWQAAVVLKRQFYFVYESKFALNIGQRQVSVLPNVKIN